LIKILKHSNFDNIQSQWKQVFEKSHKPTVFLTNWWNQTWWQYFNDNSSIEIIEIYENENLIGIAPLSIKDNTVKFIGDEDLYDYRDFIIIEGKESIFFEQLVKYIYSLRWSSIQFNSIPNSSSTLSYLPAFFEEGNNEVSLNVENSTPTLMLPQTWDKYLSQLSKKNRHELKRKIKRLESQTKYEAHICMGKEIHDQCLENFFDLHKSSSKNKFDFWNDKREKFFDSISKELISQNNLILQSLILNKTSVATAFIIKSDQSFLLYNSGFNPAYSAYSVGLLNTAFAIKNAIETGQNEFNFLKGKEKYKYHLGARDVDIYTLSINRPTV